MIYTLIVILLFGNTYTVHGITSMDECRQRAHEAIEMWPGKVLEVHCYPEGVNI